MTEAFSADRIASRSRPVPRYTSYPTAPIWRKDFDPSDYTRALGVIQAPISVYAHIPFCREQCWFCGCNMVVAGRSDVATRYLDALERQVALLPLSTESVATARIHLGGGTPTWLSVRDLERLFAFLSTRFDRTADAEMSIEADPDVTTDEHLDALVELGVNRLSLGVQSFDPRVLDAIHRPQDPARIGALVERARMRKMGGVNLDLVYGLPHQTPSSFADTLDRTIALRPDRIAVYAYAHVPWMKIHQRRIESSALPGPLARVELALQARERFLEAGYVAVGMDHYALRDDELAIAQTEGRLSRDFMGYTTRLTELVAFGMSGISELRGVYAQQVSRLGTWWRAVEEGTSVIERGWVLDAEDQLRRDTIRAIMCNFAISFEDMGKRHGIVFGEHFEAELRALRVLEEDGFVEVGAGEIRVPPEARMLVRNVAAVFDAYLKRGDGAGAPRYSQAV